MTTTTVRPDNSIPVAVSWEYKLPTPISSVWVEIVDIVGGMAQVRGLNGAIAEWEVPVWKFDDIVVDYREGGMLLITEVTLDDITTEDGYDLVGK